MVESAAAVADVAHGIPPASALDNVTDINATVSNRLLRGIRREPRATRRGAAFPQENGTTHFVSPTRQRGDALPYGVSPVFTCDLLTLWIDHCSEGMRAAGGP